MADGRRDLHDEIIDLVRALGVEVQHVGQVFADEQGLHETDLKALLHVMRAETGGQPATAGSLGAALGITSGAVTGVVDRLVRSGHVQRGVDQRDRRKVVLRYSPAARAMAEEFFAPLAAVSDEVMNQFRLAELEAIRRFLRHMTDAMTKHAGGRP